MKRYLLLIIAIVALVAVASAGVETSFQTNDLPTGLSCMKLLPFTNMFVPSSDCIVRTERNWTSPEAGDVGLQASQTSSIDGAIYNVVVLNYSYPAYYSSATFRTIGYYNQLYPGYLVSPEVFLLDDNYEVMHTELGDHTAYCVISTNASGNGTQMSVQMTETYAIVFKDGAPVSSTGMYQGGSECWWNGLPHIPTHVAWGYVSITYAEEVIDDVTWGTAVGSSQHFTDYSVGIPNGINYYLKKDMINPAANGLYYAPTDSLVASSQMISSYSRGFDSVTTTNSQYLDFMNFDTGVVYGSVHINNNSVRTARIPINISSLFASTAPYGQYVVKLRGADSSVPVYSNPIFYIGSGATVSWGSNQYGAGETGTINYAVATGGYWNPSLYTYRMLVQDAYGSTKSNQSVSAQTGTLTYTIPADSSPGVLYALLYATPKSGGTPILMNYGATEVTTIVNFEGYVMDEDGTTLGYAEVAIAQANETVVVANASGFYSSPGWVTGSLTQMNTSYPGFTSFNNSFTPLVAGTIPINITLESPDAFIPTAGIAVGGVVREPPYMRPIPGALVAVKNSTAFFTSTTNIAGYYFVDNLVDGTVYDVWGSKAKYLNSTIYNVTVVNSG